MSTELICKVCNKSYTGEDFCPVHGTPLAIPEPTGNGPGVASSAAGASAQPGIDIGPAAEVAGAAAGESPTTAEAEVPAAAVDTHASSAESKLQQFLKKNKLRKVVQPAGKDEVAPNNAQEQSPLPPEAAEKGWRITGPVATCAAWDVWPVAIQLPSGAVSGWFRRYRTGALTMRETYQRLTDAVSPCLPRLFLYGTVDVTGARADYDLVSLPKSGIPLSQWLAEMSPSEERVLEILPAIARLLARLQEAGFRPMTLEPAHIMRNSDGELCLAVLGAMGDPVAGSTNVLTYRPEFAQSALLSSNWTAPESVQQCVFSPNSAVFSAGQLLAHAAWGQPCSHAELLSGAVPFQALSDTRLARVLMGCLWPHAKGRWTFEDLLLAIEDPRGHELPVSAPWTSLVPGASATSVSFAGAAYWRMDDLLAVATQPSHWDEAVSALDRVLAWAQTTAWVGQARLMLKELAAGHSPDRVLVRLNRVVRPDAPITWRGLDLSDEQAQASLVGLAQRALSGHAGDVATMRALLHADLRGAFESVQPSI